MLSVAVFPVLLLTPNDLSSLLKVFRAGSEGAQSVGPWSCPKESSGAPRGHGAGGAASPQCQSVSG